jgi:hypothetical protein
VTTLLRFLGGALDDETPSYRGMVDRIAFLSIHDMTNGEIKY